MEPLSVPHLLHDSPCWSRGASFLLEPYLDPLLELMARQGHAGCGTPCVPRSDAFAFAFAYTFAFRLAARLLACLLRARVAASGKDGNRDTPSRAGKPAGRELEGGPGKRAAQRICPLFFVFLV
jgi:hypothetical protein